ncbi:MAG: 2,3-bisphosphoglycerate-independent phosphoglycerate mutase [Thermoleophilaceae bacterium]|nr:2,3-bisphosphoglycerate-independent phosphoglycerate mutase [Thermoleophilaceae bacterium]
MSSPDGPGPPPVPAVCLVILDGWGLADPGPGNAVSLADTPTFDALWDTHVHTELIAKGRAVGLPDGQMGNSEVGHLNLGAGAIVRQDLTRIDDAIEDGSFASNDVLREAMDADRVHLLGLVSDGGVHASMDHLHALIDMAGDKAIVHAFTDGRDTLPHAGAGYVGQVRDWLAETGGRIGSVSGRYYAMDRDKRWDRTELAYDAIVKGEGRHADDPVAAIEASYEEDVTDEFVVPTVIGEDTRIRDGDSVLFFNFRPDRARQMTEKLTGPDAPDTRYTCLTQYQEDWDLPVAFPPDRPDVTLASTLAAEGLAQLHVAETEKYAHVTYFFNGGEEHAYDGEERCLVDSPRDVPTYDHKPEMSARAAADAFVGRWGEEDFAFGIINFANPDMVGHTGVIPAAVAAIEAVDACLADVVAAVHAKGGACVVTADHGNADHMLEPDGSPNTAHSLNPVPFVVTAEIGGLHEGGKLADVAPTILDLLAIDQPPEMTGDSLIDHTPPV